MGSCGFEIFDLKRLLRMFLNQSAAWRLQIKRLGTDQSLFVGMRRIPVPNGKNPF